jgi:hypothetical protein
MSRADADQRIEQRGQRPPAHLVVLVRGRLARDEHRVDRRVPELLGEPVAPPRLVDVDLVAVHVDHGDRGVRVVPAGRPDVDRTAARLEPRVVADHDALADGVEVVLADRREGVVAERGRGGRAIRVRGGRGVRPGG